MTAPPPYAPGQPGPAPTYLPPGFQLPPGVALPPGYQPSPGHPFPPPATQRRGRGWWRRNWWALLVIVPLVGLTIGPDIPDWRTMWKGTDPTEPVTAASGQWLDFGGGRLRLRTLRPVRALTTYDGHPFTLPATLQVWQATIEVDVPNDDVPLGSCEILLADSRGRTYDANPSELRGADLDPPSCLRPYEGPKTGPFTTVATFVTPGAPPEGVRVTVVSEAPRYAWFPASG